MAEDVTDTGLDAYEFALRGLVGEIWADALTIFHLREEQPTAFADESEEMQAGWTRRTRELLERFGFVRLDEACMRALAVGIDAERARAKMSAVVRSPVARSAKAEQMRRVWANRTPEERAEHVRKSQAWRTKERTEETARKAAETRRKARAHG